MVGIICAIQEELDAIKSYMKEILVEDKFDNKFFVGDIGNNKIDFDTFVESASKTVAKFVYTFVQ